MNVVKTNQEKFGNQVPFSRFLTNISMGWKMTLMVFVLFLGILGVTLSAYSGLQSLRYQLSNIYDFMLVPIVAINNADSTLADVQYAVSQSHAADLSEAERANFINNIGTGNQKAEEVVSRYDTEWVTTVSPEFTQALRDGGKLALQEQEVSALTDYHASYDAYLTSLEKYLATIQSGKPDLNLANQVTENLLTARTHLQELIAINNQYADFSNSLAKDAYRQAIVTGGTVLTIATILGLILSYLIALSITGRLGDLTRIAASIQEGNLDQPAIVAGRDELGLLGATFNNMARQLKEVFATLEQRVAERTKALSSVAEVSTAASTILETDKLLQRVVDLAKERFNLYHSHIYLLSEAGNTLVLASGAGESGRQMVAEGRSIPLDREQSLVARAAREKKGVTVNDVTQAPDFLPNPLLPDTHSELAVPMMIGEQVIGVFDVQSEVIGRFTDTDIAVQTTLASQVASAVQNARSYSEVQRSQAQLTEALNISRLANWEYDFDHDLFTFNDQFYSIFHTTAEKVGGYKLSSADYARNFVHPEDGVLVGSEIQKAIESKERHYSAALEHRILFDNGETGYIAVKVYVERDENGKIIRWYGANQDITERRRLEEINRKRAIQQETINTITQKIQAATTIEDAMQIAARELGHALGNRQTLVALEPSIQAK